MKVLIVYDSVFGNTKKIAEEIGNQIGEHAEVKVTQVNHFNSKDTDNLDLLIVGSPTRGFAPTKCISTFLNSLDSHRLANTKIALFDTRMDVEKTNVKILKFMAKKCGYALDTMIGILKKKGIGVYDSFPGFIVADSEGPLLDGEMDRADVWTEKLLNKQLSGSDN